LKDDDDDDDDGDDDDESDCIFKYYVIKTEIVFGVNFISRFYSFFLKCCSKIPVSSPHPTQRSYVKLHVSMSFCS